MASRFVVLRHEVLHPYHLVVGVVDIDASLLADRCAPPTTQSSSPRHLHQSVVVAHHGRCLGAQVAAFGAPGAGSNGGSNAVQMAASPGACRAHTSCLRCIRAPGRGASRSVARASTKCLVRAYVSQFVATTRGATRE